MILKDVLKIGIDELKRNNIENYTNIARILLAFVLNQTKEFTIVHSDYEISQNDVEKFNSYIKEICNNVPLQYITKTQEFMKMNFYVDENVLIPRADTEILVENVIEIIGKKENLSVLDMCTGSGIIAISIAKYTKSNVTAVDISKKAIEIAKKNALQNNVNTISFINSNMFENIDETKKFDIIVSNPPYIETKTIKTLDKQVQKEPIIALDGGDDGLKFYREIQKNAKKYLKENGVIALEIGYNQKEAVTNLFRDEYKIIECKKDLAGLDRVIICYKGV